ncbi:MAG: hypothetical protein DRR42_28055 [Gammaproteobacteria bacterium]|nr:MAG: hypothetical protein DRR42_28055 [Gammaproteobacteria bacterium]
MQNDIFQLLAPFRPLFSRKAPFIWFIVVIFGFLLRFDHYGISSFVRWLHLPVSSYPLLIHFFHATSWSLGEVMMAWITLCQQKFPLVSLNGRLLIVGDGIKVSKESQCQPGVKFLHSPSQNQSKPQRFNGHHFGCISFVAEKESKFRPVLQAAQIHEGVDELRELQSGKTQGQTRETAVSRMMSLITLVAINQGQPMYAALDALFSTRVAFYSAFHRLQADGSPWVHLITRAKSNYVGYISALRGKKERVKLWDIFEQLSLFTEHQHPLHPDRTVKLYHRDLYWGEDSFFLRFVWGIDEGRQFILMSSDLLLSPVEILRFYGLRFQIEFGFKILKHIIGGFGYRFWSSLCRPEKMTSKQALKVIDKEKEKAIAEKSLQKLDAIERFVNLAIIAQGVLCYLALTKDKWVWEVHHASSWLRSYSSALPSDETVQRTLQSHFMTTFSLQVVKDWVNSNQQVKLPNKPPKVRKHHTLENFLLS